MSARIVALRPDGDVLAGPVSANAAEVLAYLRGLDAGDPHGYARGRREALGDLWRGALARLTAPLGRRR